MKIVVCPDKFKGSLSSAEASAAISRGIRSAIAARDGQMPEILSVPMADGGEGTLSAIIGDTGRIVGLQAYDALIRAIEAHYGIKNADGTETAVIESSDTIGLFRLSERERNPELTTSYGLGTVVADAIARGCRHIILTVGGSATSDCGAGMLAALGYVFKDTDGNVIDTPRGKDTIRIADIILPPTDSPVRSCRFTVLCDVDNPLLGTEGAAAVFAPQKGADEAAVIRLDTGAAAFSETAIKLTGKDFRNEPGAGAAGGIAWAVRTFLDAELVPGAVYVAESVGLERHIAGADLVVTGEGKFDSQSLHGKVVGYVASLAARHGVPVTVICGTKGDDLSENTLREAGIKEVHALSDHIPMQLALKDAAVQTERMTERVFREKP